MSALVSPAPSPVAPPASTLERVRAIQQSHFRETGRSLSTDDALRSLDRRDSDARAFLIDHPPKKWQVGIAVALLDLEYPLETIDRILGELARNGSVVGSSIDPEHREVIEAMMPKRDENPPWRNHIAIRDAVMAARSQASAYGNFHTWLVLDRLIDAIHGGTVTELARRVDKDAVENVAIPCGHHHTCRCGECRDALAAAIRAFPREDGMEG